MRWGSIRGPVGIGPRFLVVFEGRLGPSCSSAKPWLAPVQTFSVLLLPTKAACRECFTDIPPVIPLSTVRCFPADGRDATSTVQWQQSQAIEFAYLLCSFCHLSRRILAVRSKTADGEDFFSVIGALISLWGFADLTFPRAFAKMNPRTIVFIC
eukprot:Gb_03791 [translate_table: standard]